MPRDGSGNYTLPAGNPVVTGTTVSSAWANTTMSDVAVQLNNVLTRDGLLGPVGPFKLVDGAVATPGLAFNSEAGLGLYRIGSNILAVATQNATPLVLDSSNGSNQAMKLAPRLTSGSPQAAFYVSNQPYGTANRSEISLSISQASASLAVTGIGTGTSLPLNLIGTKFALTASAGSGAVDSFSLSDTTSTQGLNLRLTGNGGTTPNKTIRVKDGVMEWVNSAYSAVIASLTDAGVFTANNVGIFSDERLKYNFQSPMGALAKLHQLEPYLYQLKADEVEGEENTKWYRGFKAQQVREVYPELVHEDADGILSVNYIGLISEIVQALRELPLPAVLP